MILRSPKKRRTTARMSILAVLCNPQSAALGAAAALVAGVVSSPLPAQETAWRGNPGLRPVPKVRSSAIATNPKGGTAPTERAGWNLQWRTSPEIAAEQARQISDAAFAQTPSAGRAGQTTSPENYTPRSFAATTSSRSEASMPRTPANSLRPTATTSLQQVAWSSPQSESPSNGFSLPENDFRGPTLAPPSPTGPSSLTEPSSLGPSLQSPSPSAEQTLPSPAPSATLPSQPAAPSAPGTAPSQAPNDKLEKLFGFGPTTNQRSGGPGTAPAQANADGSSIRGMIQGEPAGPSLLTPAPAESQKLQVLPPGIPQKESTDSPSDLESFAPNPFENRDANRSTPGGGQAQRDQLDRDRLERGVSPEMVGADQEGPANSGTGLSCDEFRERIRSATIDQVSLDPSPPFRPDVIDVKEFDKLKDRFNENQKVRTWRSIDGRPMGTGRLDDLAYENAIIRTEFGTKEELALNQLSEADLAYISQNWGLPTECLIEQVAYAPRQWTPTTMTYTASNLCHKPLYFEEVNLERYGHTAGPLAQPIISSAHFFLNIAVLPYKMGVHAPSECQYALGYYRPGNCAPWIIPPVPLSVRGAWYQAAAVTGTALLIP